MILLVFLIFLDAWFVGWDMGSVTLIMLMGWEFYFHNINNSNVGLVNFVENWLNLLMVMEVV